jgi:hypothetical protein
VERELDVDSVRIDDAGHVAVFLGDDESPPPTEELGTRTSELLERLAEYRVERVVAGVRSSEYRMAASLAQEPIFDAPALHVRPLSGYGHLVVSAAEGEPTVRRLLGELGGREVTARRGYAVVLEALGPVSYDELHQDGACLGCRPHDHLEDPPLRSPEALAIAGLYVYGYARGEWLRIVSPSVPAERGDLQDRVGLTIHAAPSPLRFETTPRIAVTS